MLIDLTCPAEVFEAALPTTEIPAASLALYNLSDRVIVSVEVTLKLLGGSGSEKERVTYRARALNGRPHSTFPMTVPCNPNPAARRTDVTIDKVWFSDNAVWRRETSTSVEYTPNDLPVSKALTNLKFVAGENAVGYPTLQDGLWLCVCGRPNPENLDVCVRCRRPRELVFTRFNREAVEKQINQRERQLELSTRSVREDTARMQRIREEEFNLKKDRKARRLRLAVTLPILLAILAALYFGIVPGLRLWSADRTMKAGNYSDAFTTLADLGSFPGAESRLAECEWQIAKEHYDTAITADDTTELQRAAEELRYVKGHPEAEELARKADLRRAALFVEAKDPDSAREALAELPEDDPQRVDLENECLFLDAMALMEAGDYVAARELFLTLTDVAPNAAELAAECVYIPAAQLMAEGKYDEAIEEMSRIPDHPLSRSAILECHYHKAEIAEAEGDIETAAAEYLMADDWGDAKDKTNITVYTLAENAYADGDLEKAQTLFASLPGYDPAVKRNNECLLEMAKKAVNDKDYERAMDLLDMLPEDYEPAKDMIPRTAYLAGTDALKRKDAEKAVQWLEEAGDYRDAPSKLETALDLLVKSRLDEGDAAGALELLPRITHSKNYSKYKQEAEYQDAVIRAEGGADPAEMLPVFEAMGDYKEAKTWVKRLNYDLAEQAEKLGESLNAAHLYEKAGDWNDAAERAAALYDEYYGERADAAKTAAEAGDWPLVVTILESFDLENLPSQYADLAQMYEDACMNAGEQLFEAGRPYEAARYFRLVKDTRRTSRWMQNACYRILGKWVDQTGTLEAVFREDSTCEIAGEHFVFLVSDSYTLRTETDGEMVPTFRITDLTDRSLSLRDMRQGHDESYNFYKVNEEEPVQEEKPAEQPETGTGDGEPAGDDDYKVADD